VACLFTDWEEGVVGAVGWPFFDVWVGGGRVNWVLTGEH